jgi:hypothetical protein
MDTQDNLTLKAKIVSAPYEGVVPQPGHDLVVFEKVGAGKQGARLVKTLKDMEKFYPIPFKDYLSYAVKNAAYLDYEFKSDVFHKDESLTGTDNRILRHGFILTIRLKFYVYDPSYLVIHINNDPFGAVCKEIQNEVGADIRKHSWDALRNAKDLDNCRKIFDDILTAEKLKYFDDYAQSLGVKLLKVNCDFDFAGKDLQVIEAHADTLAEERINSLRSEIDRQQSAIKRGEKTYDHLASGIQTIIGSIAEDTDTVDKLKRLLNETKNISAELYGLPQPKQDKALPDSYRAELGLLAGLPNGRAELLKEMQRAIENYDASKLSSAKGREILTPILHWLVDLSLGDRADAEVVEKYRATIAKTLVEMTDKREISDAKAEEILRLLESKQELMRRFV